MDDLGMRMDDWDFTFSIFNCSRDDLGAGRTEFINIYDEGVLNNGYMEYDIPLS
jgi:hypothetical protein